MRQNTDFVKRIPHPKTPPATAHIKRSKEMAKQATYFGQLTEETINGRESYRVKFPYGTFSIAVKATHSGTYHYAVKRHKGQLFKVYVGTAGEITSERVHQATMELLHKAYAAKGQKLAMAQPRCYHWTSPKVRLPHPLSQVLLRRASRQGRTFCSFRAFLRGSAAHR
jgi:hypothetical protein